MDEAHIDDVTDDHDDDADIDVDKIDDTDDDNDQKTDSDTAAGAGLLVQAPSSGFCGPRSCPA